MRYGIWDFKIRPPPSTRRLHVIDFEQLKIENQSVIEKIEERDDELVKLKKKNTASVQVRIPVTHFKFVLHSNNDYIRRFKRGIEFPT